MNLDFEDGVSPRSYIRHTYYDAIWAAGGNPVLIAPIVEEAFLDHWVSEVDGLVLTGGDDLDPALYGATPHPKNVHSAPRRQAFDLALTRRALERGVPLLGICAGLQTLNVALGGDLIQDIPSLVPEALCHHTHDPRRPAEHEVRIEPGSRLASLLGGAERIVANSAHHQSVGRVGRGLRAVAFAPDGVVEGIERAQSNGDEPLCVAVQWHPERIIDREPHLRLFCELVAAARGGR